MIINGMINQQQQQQQQWPPGTDRLRDRNENLFVYLFSHGLSSASETYVSRKLKIESIEI